MSIGPKDVAQQLRSALAMGADRAILRRRRGRRRSTPTSVARTSQKLVEREKPDLVAHGQAGRRRRLEPGRPAAWPACSAGRRRPSPATIEVAAGGKARSVGARGRRRRRGRRRCRCRRWSPSTCASSRRRRSRTARRPPTHAYAEGAALRVAQGHHGGEEEADRRDHARRRSASTPRRTVKVVDARGAAGAQGGHQGRRRSRSWCRSSTTKRRCSDGANVLVVLSRSPRRARCARRRCRRSRRRASWPSSTAARSSRCVIGAGVAGRGRRGREVRRGQGARRRRRRASRTTSPRPARRSSPSAAKDAGRDRRRRRPRPRPARTCCRASAALLDAGHGVRRHRRRRRRSSSAGRSYAGNAIADGRGRRRRSSCATVRQTEFEPRRAAGAAGAGRDVARRRRSTRSAPSSSACTRTKSERPELDRRQGRRLGRPRHEGGRELQGARGAHRSARRRAWAPAAPPCDAGMVPERPAGRPDRQGGRARSSTSRSRSPAPSSTWPA